MNDRDVEAALRASLAARAGNAPTGELLAERIIDEALAGPRPTRDFHRPRGPRWRTWTLPVIAAGSVAAIVGTLVGVSHLQHNAAPVPPAVSHSVTPSPTATPRQVVPPVVTAPSPAVSSANAARLIHFRVLDLTFVQNGTVGWALGTADCTPGSGYTGTCTALVHTTNGTTWASMINPPVNVPGVTAGCATSCVDHIRFANDRIGYVYGQNAFFMTTDGGARWTQERGGADALETLQGNVIRLISPHSGCPGPCDLGVQVAPIGTTAWTNVALPGGTVGASTVSLVRTGRDAFVETSFGVAGSLYTVNLYTSTDNGQAWTKRPDPCRTVGAAVAGVPLASQNITVAADGSLSILCAGAGTTPELIVTSTDGGTGFTASPIIKVDVANGGLGPIGAASAHTFVGYAGSALYRTANDGRTWTRFATSASNGDVNAPGFQTSTAGRWVAPDQSSVWTTRDAGKTWTPYTFG